MKKKIIVYERVEQPVLEQLEEMFDVHFFKNIDTKRHKQFLTCLHEAEGIIGIDLPVDEELLNHAPKLKVVSNVSVGYNNLNIEQLTKRGIMATNTPNILTDTVADAIFALLLATARRIPELDQFVKTKQWTELLTSAQYGVDVHHKTIGIIGMGRIGQAIAQRAYGGFNMDVLYHSRTRKQGAEERFQATYCSLETLLQEADFIVLMTPLTDETRGLIGGNEFKQMKNSAIFINGSRGQTVVEKELIYALKTGEIAAAGLDVFEMEPVSFDNPLLQMNNVVTLPHIGSSTHETELKMSQLAAKNLIAGLRGDKPPTLINESVWKDA